MEQEKKGKTLLFARSGCSNNGVYSAVDQQGLQLMGEFGLQRGMSCPGMYQVCWNGTNKVCKKQNLSFSFALALWGQKKALTL